ncbi:MAG: S8 family serine peptidase [Rhodoluna sp.]
MRGVRFQVAATATLALAISFLTPAQAANAVIITPASAVKSVAVKDAWSIETPRTARAKITWIKPANLYGAKLVSYKVQRSTDNKNWTTAIASTGLVNSAVVSSGLKIGAVNYFRVKAITQKGSTRKAGAASPVISKKLTAVPASPVLLGLTSISVSEASPTYSGLWAKQSAAAKGGLDVTYTLKATADGYDEVTCSTISTGCTLEGLEPGVLYNTALSAVNKKGPATNLDVVTPADADYLMQWYLNSEFGIAADRAWTLTKGSSSVVVAVLDSGITPHPEIDSQLVTGYDFVSNSTKAGDGDGIDADPTDIGDGVVGANGQPDPPSSWHGTHVAGIIAAKADDIGVTGIAPNVKVQPIRVLGAQGQGSAADLAIAILWAAGYSPADIQSMVSAYPYRVSTDLSKVPSYKTPAKIINMSMAGPGSCPGIVQMAVIKAEQKNVLLVSAAGNGDEENIPQPNTNYYPTNCAGPISVGATSVEGDATHYSNYGVDISAPGGDQRNSAGAPGGTEGMIFSTSNDGEVTIGEPAYALAQGTSMAAPVVSGILALMISAKPGATPDQIWQALKESATPFAAGTTCSTGTQCGVGIANAANALKRLFEIVGQ